MRPFVPALTVAALAAAGLVCAGPASAASSPASLHAGHVLRHGQRLVSPGGRYHAAVEQGGRLVVRTAHGTRVWSTPKAGAGGYLALGRSGQLALKAGGRVAWRSRTSGSGRSDVLTLRGDGELALTSRGLLVWSSRIGTACPRRAGRAFVVDLSRQLARACRNGQQLRATYVTTGAVARGDATPRGTWHVQARIRNTTLYPAAGGAYPVHYWMPYDGAYGIHDSPWQHFAYGSAKYRTRGSHGCVHVPGAMMKWLFGWARVGTTVTIHG